MCSHVIWDMGGTLIDTYPAVDAMLARVAHNAPSPVADQLREAAALRRASISHAMRTLSKKYGTPIAQFERAYAQLKEGWRTHPAPLMDGAREVMAAVSAAGGLNLISTHRDRTSAQNLLRALKVEVDDMVCAPDGWPRKPDPAMALELMRRHSIAPASVLCVGDRPIDVQAAHNAGCFGVLLDRRDDDGAPAASTAVPAAPTTTAAPMHRETPTVISGLRELLPLIG